MQWRPCGRTGASRPGYALCLADYVSPSAVRGGRRDQLTAALRHCTVGYSTADCGTAALRRPLLLRPAAPQHCAATSEGVSPGCSPHSLPAPCPLPELLPAGGGESAGQGGQGGQALSALLLLLLLLSSSPPPPMDQQPTVDRGRLGAGGGRLGALRDSSLPGPRGQGRDPRGQGSEGRAGQKPVYAQVTTGAVAGLSSARNRRQGWRPATEQC